MLNLLQAVYSSLAGPVLAEASQLSPELLLLLSLLLLAATAAAYLLYSGLFTTVTVSSGETEYGPMVVAYKTLVGPYKACGEIFTESFCLLPDREQLGIYYDDPEGVAGSQLRSAVGPILARGGEKPVPAEMEKMIQHGFRIVHLPRPSYVVTASFPFRTTLSIFMAIYKVYPKLRNYIAERNLCAYPALEVYRDNSILFLMPLSRQDEFFVSQFQEEEVSVATTEVESVAGSLASSVMESPLPPVPQPHHRNTDQDGFLIPSRPPTSMARQEELSADEAEVELGQGWVEVEEAGAELEEAGAEVEEVAAEVEEQELNAEENGEEISVAGAGGVRDS